MGPSEGMSSDGPIKAQPQVQIVFHL